MHRHLGGGGASIHRYGVVRLVAVEVVVAPEPLLIITNHFLSLENYEVALEPNSGPNNINHSICLILRTKISSMMYRNISEIVLEGIMRPPRW